MVKAIVLIGSAVRQLWHSIRKPYRVAIVAALCLAAIYRAGPEPEARSAVIWVIGYHVDHRNLAEKTMTGSTQCRGFFDQSVRSSAACLATAAQ